MTPASLHEPEALRTASTARTWALVLAAGEGTRLRSLTTTLSGVTIPKQFCSLSNGPALLQEALSRAYALASPALTCAVVAAQHERWWRPILSTLPTSNLIVQPLNRGTAIGIVLPLLHLVARDPGAQVVLMPADHHVQEEAILANALHGATQLQERDHCTVLLGLEPEETDPDLGYIVPRRGTRPELHEVSAFIEKPAHQKAEALVDQGALWNAFIVISSAQALLALCRARIPEIVYELERAVRIDVRGASDGHAVAALYPQLPTIDFSRDILQGQEAQLRVLPVARCGWCDLGTPARVVRTLRRTAPVAKPAQPGVGALHLSLAAQHQRLEPTLDA